MSNGYVLGFLFNKDLTKVLLIRKNRPYWQEGFYNGIGGKIESNESKYDAMVREFKEETGLDIPTWNYFCNMLHEGNHIFIFSRVYWCNDFPILQVSNNEGSAYEIPIKNLETINIIPNLKWLIPMAIESYNVKLFRASIRYL